MSSLKSLKKTGVHKISVHLSEEKSSKVGAISTSKMPENEKTMLPKCDLVDKELLSNDVKDVKSFKKTRNSSLASTSRRKLEALDVASDNSRKNGSNTNENKRVGKKIDPLEKRISRNSTLPGKLKSTSTKFLLSDGESLDLKDIAVENEVNHSNNKSDKKLSHVFKKKKVTDSVARNSNLEEHKIMKSTDNWGATLEDKENYKFELQPLQQERLKKVRMSEIQQGNWDKKRVIMKCPVASKFRIDTILLSPYTSGSKSTSRSSRIAAIAIRRSERIAGMQKISYKL